MKFKKSASVLLSATLVLGVYSANPASYEAATPLAEELNAPILLTGKNKLNSTTKSEIERLGAHNVYLTVITL